MKKLLLILTVIAISLSLAACGGATKVDLSQYLSVSFTGYNGNGTARIHFDFSDFEYGIMSQWKDEDMMKKLAELTAVETTITYAADVSEGLRNGDTITVKISFNEEKAKEYGYAFAGLEKKFTVEGLTEPVVIDPFAEEIFGSGKVVDVTFEGVDPFVCLFLRNNAEWGDPIRYIKYKVDNDWNLKNGDVVTITAVLDDKYQQQGYLLSRTETTITIEGFDRYASAASDLTADALRRISQRAYQECVDGASVDIYDGISNKTPWGASFDNIHVSDTAMLAVNKQIDETYSFLLIPVYKTITKSDWYDMAANASVSKTWENVIGFYKFYDVIVHPDGSVSYNESYVELKGNYTDTDVADVLYLNDVRSDYELIEVSMP